MIEIYVLNIKVVVCCCCSWVANNSPKTYLNHFTNCWCVYYLMLLTLFNLTWKIMIQSVHSGVHVTTALLSRHVHNCELIGSLDLTLEQLIIWQDLGYKLKDVREIDLTASIWACCEACVLSCLLSKVFPMGFWGPWGMNGKTPTHSRLSRIGSGKPHIDIKRKVIIKQLASKDCVSHTKNKTFVIYDE